MSEIRHNTLKLSDKLTLLGDLEHARHHALRSAHSAEDETEKFWYTVKAVQAEELRREAQHKWAEAGELDWCLIKVGTRLKWENEETFDGDLELFSKIESFADDLLSHGLKADLSGCSACRDDESELKSG